MLYDPRWEVKTKPSLAGFIAWLETKNPKARYNYMNIEGLCPVDQYFTSIGIGVDTWRDASFPSEQWAELNDLACDHRTFGALLREATLKDKRLKRAASGKKESDSG
jgi:hypothetical protein